MKKICTKCKINKALEEYYKDNRTKDGRYSKCKSCHNVMTTEYSKTDKGKAIHAKYYKSDKGKAAKARGNSKSKCWKSKTLCTLDDKEFNFIVFTAQNNKCACCGRTFTKKLIATRDHIYPVSKGGDFIKENIQALCVECNSRKKDKYIDYRTELHKNAIAKKI